MGRKFVITEEQYQAAISEGVNPNQNAPTVEIPKGVDTKQGANAEIDKLKNGGYDPKKNGLNLTQQPSQTTNVTATTNESRIITKAQMMESRLNNLKKHSKTYTLKEFMMNLK